MDSDNVRERKEARRYTFIVVPDVKSEKTRSVSLSRWGIIIGIVSAFIIMAALVVAVIIYTPVGSRLPMASPELARQYGKQIAEIGAQLQALSQQVNTLRSTRL
jgi:hypothetical protein